MAAWSKRKCLIQVMGFPPLGLTCDTGAMSSSLWWLGV